MSGTIGTYREITTSTASPRAVVLKVYERAIDHLRQAEAACARGEQPLEHLAKAQTLVTGLVSALDLSAGDLASKLLSLYVFVGDRIRDSHAGKRDAGLGAARRVLEELHAGWQQIPADARRPDGRTPGEFAGFHLSG